MENCICGNETNGRNSLIKNKNRGYLLFYYVEKVMDFLKEYLPVFIISTF